MLTDPLFLGVTACIGTACLIAYLLGRYHGIESAFASLRRSQERAGDWPAALQGDLPHLHIHARRSGR